MKVTKSMALAIGSAIDREGGALPLSKLCGVNNAILKRYAIGTQPEMTDKTWEKLYPHVKQHLPDDPSLLPRSLWVQATMSLPGQKSRRATTAAIPPVLMQLCQNWDALPQSARSAVLAVATMALSAVATGGK